MQAPNISPCISSSEDGPLRISQRDLPPLHNAMRCDGMRSGAALQDAGQSTRVWGRVGARKCMSVPAEQLRGFQTGLRTGRRAAGR